MIVKGFSPAVSHIKQILRRRFETEVIGMTASMLHGDSHVVGSMTSGGTESLLMAVKTYRDRARDLFPHITHPEMVTIYMPFSFPVLIPLFCSIP